MKNNNVLRFCLAQDWCKMPLTYEKKIVQAKAFLSGKCVIKYTDQIDHYIQMWTPQGNPSEYKKRCLEGNQKLINYRSFKKDVSIIWKEILLFMFSIATETIF